VDKNNPAASNEKHIITGLVIGLPHLAGKPLEYLIVVVEISKVEIEAVMEEARISDKPYLQSKTYRTITTNPVKFINNTLFYL
jgi:hypothetical protein